MIPSSHALKLAAAGVAVVAHGALGIALYAPEPVLIEDQAGSPGEVRLGASFQDMAAGTLTAQTPTRTAPVPPVRTATPAPTAPAPSPAQVPFPAPSQTQTVAALPAPAAPAPRAAPVRTPAAAQAPPTPQAAAPAAQATSRAAEPERTTPLASPRPPARSAAFEAEHAPQRPRPTAQPPRGNAAADARAGARDGTRAAPATRSGSDARGTSAGNAAARNYPGQIAACVRRSAGGFAGGGLVGVSFRIAASGAVTGVSVARSSGIRSVDRSAVRAIASAGPCPPPPAGAQRRFTITVG